MDRNIEQARKIIDENIYMVISSASREGKPWISPVFFAYDEFRVTTTLQVRGSAVWRIYRATPTKIWKLGQGDYVNGQYVDTKAEIIL